MTSEVLFVEMIVTEIFISMSALISGTASGFAAVILVVAASFPRFNLNFTSAVTTSGIFVEMEAAADTVVSIAALLVPSMTTVQVVLMSSFFIVPLLVMLTLPAFPEMTKESVPSFTMCAFGAFTVREFPFLDFSM